MNEFLNSVLSGLIGGLVVWGIQQWYSNRKERLTQDKLNVVASLNSKKIVTATIIDDLKPGRNLNIVNEMLGQPVKELKSDESVFSGDTIFTNSYLYIVKNACIKITSKDNLCIDSLTVFPNDTSFVLKNIPNPMDASKVTLNQTKVANLADKEWDHTVIVARHDETFALRTYIANPLYQTYTYFGYFGGDKFMGNWIEYKQSNNPSLFTGGTLTGICVSNDQDDAFYIYSYELR
jgi:hypothetical protein